MLTPMKVVKVLFILCLTLNPSVSEKVYSDDDALELILKAGYQGESHEVETKDGYILKVQRILPSSGRSLKPPAFLMHGMIATSADYLITGPKIALAFYLSDNGYDVWLGNARGSKHSMNHKYLSPNSGKFWKFSWHEIGHYDLPAMIDYVLKVTGSRKTFYVGHSQGTTSLLVFLSTRPEYNDKILQAHLFAPAAFMTYFPHQLAKSLIPEIRRGFFQDYKYINLGTFYNVGKQLSRIYCANRVPTLAVCRSFLFAIVGENRHGIELDTRILKDIITHVSPRFSVNQLVHYAQSIESGKFRHFDFRWGNIAHYNSTTPPDYPVQNITAPVYLYGAAEDLLVSLPDIEHLKSLLQNVKRHRVFRNWNHVDFTYGKNARKYLYKDVLGSFENFREE